MLWWPGQRPSTAPLLAADARALDLASALGAAADDAGRPLAYLTGRAPCVRALGASRDTLVLATRGGELWQLPLPWDTPMKPPSMPPLDLDASIIAPPRLLVQGHAAPKKGAGEGEAVALAVDPSDGDIFVTGGDDGSVRVWSVSRRRMLAMRVLPLPVLANPAPQLGHNRGYRGQSVSRSRCSTTWVSFVALQG